MADILRLVVVQLARRPVVLRDYQDVNTYFRVKDSFKHVPAPRRPATIAYEQRYGGSQTIGEGTDNGAITFTVAVQGASSDAGITGVENLVGDLERYAPASMFVEFRPNGATYSTFYEVRGPATWQWNYNQPQFAGTTLSMIDLTVPVAPLAQMDQMDIIDDFSVNSISDYTVDGGSASDVTISGGTMAPAGTMSTERRLVHTVRGYRNTDVQDTVQFTIGSTLALYKAGCVVRRASATNYLECYVDDTGAASRLRIDSVIGGVRTNKVSSSMARLVVGQVAWIRARVEGVNLFAEFFSSVPTPTATAAASLGTTLTLSNFSQAELDAVASGSSGLSWIPVQANARLDDFEHLPYTFFNKTLPDLISLTSVPGSAEALADVHVTNASGGGSAPIWPLVCWSAKSAPHNYVWNGDFEEDVNGWNVALVTGVQAVAGTSITRDTTAARTKFGAANGSIVTPASTGSGANFPLYRRFRPGYFYTAILYASSAAGTTSMVLKLGASGDQATSVAAALTTTPTAYTVTWSPLTDRDVAFISIQTNAATATTFSIDGVMVFEGAVAPTVGRHAQGAGAVPPFGIIEAETADTGDLTGWALTTGVAASRMSALLFDSAVSGAESYSAGWWIDPSLITQDDFAAGEVDIEFWARMTVNAAVVTPKVFLSARPEWGTSFGAERWTAEYGAGGKILTKPSAGATYRTYRLGTITFPVDTTRPARWKLWLAATTAAGSTGDLGLDYIMAVPIRNRVAGTTAKANDSAYPDFIASTAETTRIITSSLRGLAAKPPFPAQPVPGAVGGPQIEVPIGNADLMVKLSSLVPDDPTIDATTEAIAHTGTVHVAVTPRVYLMRGA